MFLNSRTISAEISYIVFALLVGMTGGCGKKNELPISHVKVDVCEPGLSVFRSEPEWDKFWVEHKPYGQIDAVPRVDFDKFIAVLASTGRTNAGAASISIPRAVMHDNNTAEVVIHTDKAGEGCIVTRAAVCPTDMVLLPKGSYSVRLTEESVIRNCRDR